MEFKIGDRVSIFNSMLGIIISGTVVRVENNYYDVDVKTSTSNRSHVFHFEKFKLRGLREGLHLQIIGKKL